MSVSARIVRDSAQACDKGFGGESGQLLLLGMQPCRAREGIVQCTDRMGVLGYVVGGMDQMMRRYQIANAADVGCDNRKVGAAGFQQDVW